MVCVFCILKGLLFFFFFNLYFLVFISVFFFFFFFFLIPFFSRFTEKKNCQRPTDK